MKVIIAIASCVIAAATLAACAPHNPGLSASAAPAWKMYQDAGGRFGFEYPAVYDEPAYRDRCAPRAMEEGAAVGARSELVFLDAGGSSLAESADKLLESKEWTEESRADETVGGRPALTVAYRFGGLNRYGTFTLIPFGDKLLALGFSAGAPCDIPAAGITELDAYRHIIESIQFAQ
jgi:hypothetical protein